MRFRRALDRGNVTEALSAASELQFVALAEPRAHVAASRARANEIRASGGALARSVRSGGPARRPARKPGGARAPRGDPGEPPRCECACGVPESPAVVRADRRGPCPLVASGVRASGESA